MPESLFEKKFDSIRYSVFGHSSVMRFNQPVVATVSRKKFSGWHYDSVKHKNVRLVDGVGKITILERSVIFDGRTAEFDFLVGADGAHSIVRNHLGMPVKRHLNAIQTHIPVRAVKLELIVMTRPLGYLWVFPHADCTSFGAGGLNPDVSMKELKSILDRFLTRRKLIATDYSAGIINFDYRGYRQGRIFLCGEAAGLTSAISGEGIYFAMASGREVAKEIISPGHRSERLKKIIRKVKRDIMFTRILKFAQYLGIERIVLPFFIRYKYRHKSNRLGRKPGKRKR
jgi:geranylgeranyl reductase